MMKKSDLPITEELQFHYLLSLMRPLNGEPLFTWLPQLFSIIGHERLIMLCNYAGGEVIRIPTLDELQTCLEALEYFYRSYIQHEVDLDIPKDLAPIVHRISEIYDSENSV